ncbi:hypothetical protein EYF80_007704 [Liparis tanakae]|uniref:Uncharacterized protein n=1 Tax=Liparis tanakae TaxID=230148 RepID=A0A4Z2IX15_9TELE|nr:hypothetical protein EYF80_007704 [Liparis tanakae]
MKTDACTRRALLERHKVYYGGPAPDPNSSPRQTSPSSLLVTNLTPDWMTDGDEYPHGGAVGAIHWPFHIEVVSTFRGDSWILQPNGVAHKAEDTGAHAFRHKRNLNLPYCPLAPWGMARVHKGVCFLFIRACPLTRARNEKGKGKTVKRKSL